MILFQENSRQSIDICSVLKSSHFIPIPQILTESVSPSKRQLEFIIINCYILLEHAHCLYPYTTFTMMHNF